MAWHRMDDLDGSPAEQVLFGLDEKLYTIDLGQVNRAKLEKALRPFLAVAQPFATMPPPSPLGVGDDVTFSIEDPEDPEAEDVLPEPTPAPRVVAAKSARKPRGPRGKQSSSAPQATIRQWAMQNGYQVSDRGRIPDAVMQAYTLAN